jgi:mycothiol synthase
VRGVIAIDTDRITARLPRGYRARPFEDADREAIVAERNAWSHEMEQQDANEWRMWERLSADPTQYRVVVVDESSERIGGYANVGAGGFMRHPDGAQSGGVTTARFARGQGIGSALLAEIEDEARRRNAPRLLAGASAAHPFALEWAAKRGFTEIGRRIESYVDLASFDATKWAEKVSAVKATGIVFRTFADVMAGLEDDARERFYREVFEAQRPMWEDIPFATPTEPWPYERFRTMAFESGQMVADASVIAYDGDTIAGFTQTGKRQDRDGYTWMTGTARAYRGRGIATALKVAALDLAKQKGFRAMLTTNDEPNKAMRGINDRLGYQMLPAHVQLEKKL